MMGDERESDDGRWDGEMRGRVMMGDERESDDGR